MRLLDDLRPADHLLQLVDAVVQAGDLFFCLLVLGVVLDVPRLGGLLHPVRGFDAALQRYVEIVLQLGQAFVGQQDRLREVHG